MNSQLRPIVFLHIPKTAGLTFHEILTDQYPQRKHKLIYTVGHTKTFIELPEKKKAKIGVIKGHLLYGLHDFMPNKPIYITLLRDPIARTISGFEFIKNKKDHPFYKELKLQKYTLYDFLNQQFIPNFDNMHVRFLCGNNSMPFGTINESHFEMAKKNLITSNMLFGITEMFDESILCFKNELGWTNPFYSKVNVAKNNSLNMQNIDPATRDMILNCNKFDIQLYQFAKDKFLEKIKMMGKDFKDELNVFQENNHKMQQRLKFRNYFRSFVTRFNQG
jgi:hypothetical protein